MKRSVLSVCSGVLAVCVLLVLSPSARADDMGGLWPVKDGAVVAAHEAGLDGSGVKIGVYDTQVVSDYPGLSDANVKYQVGSFRDADNQPAKCVLDDGELQATATSKESGDYSSHGTHMLLWLLGNGRSWDGSQGITGLVPKADVLFVTGGRGGVGINLNVPCKGMVGIDTDKDVGYLVNSGVRIINMSNIGSLGDYGYNGMLQALRNGVIIVSGRSNDTETDPTVDGSSADALTGDPRFWSSFPGVLRNNEVGPDGGIASISDVADANVNILSPGDKTLVPSVTSKKISIDSGGTSTGAAVLSGYLALAVQRWPEATGNQILQSLVRNTKGNDSGEPRLDPGHKRGFGQVDPARLLSVDPTQYPDVNPILEAQVTAAARLKDDRSKWYTQDCSKNAEGIGNVLDDIQIPCQAGEIGREYERQKAAWAKVEECRAGGGSDCMRYSATATAGQAEDESRKGSGSDGAVDESGVSAVPSWLWVGVGVAGAVVVVGGVVLAVVLSRRGRRRPRPGVSAAAGPLPYGGPVPGAYPRSYPQRSYPQQYPVPVQSPVQAPQAPEQQIQRLRERQQPR
ncbi:S8 family serine peptidase [Bifidobacterium sp. LC6]|uniref:S8 family serine peptidase n=1 Tax=Bifidobacterium colobi TaxID=2809026 RepID=A0ABS5UUX8_9BIFI|nr:S8 family serine peptidase [Bifidobacterium colobi]MBT1174536.1 S8 family serine peptidase [Bifidobacterium colobi]